MEENMNIDILDFGAPEKDQSIIKVIGVGGGGGNAVNHMYREGIHDVTFVLCNTDNQALNDSPVPVHLQLGKEGLGAGNKPEKARQAAEESLQDITQICTCYRTSFQGDGHTYRWYRNNSFPFRG